MESPSAAPNWAFYFLSRMLTLMFIGPILGAVILASAGLIAGGDQTMPQLALLGAKWVGLPCGFAAPLIALALTTRAIHHHRMLVDELDALPPPKPKSGNRPDR